MLDKEKRTFAITKNLRSNIITEWVKQYKANESLRGVKRNDSIVIYHEILSWHEQDQNDLSIEKIQAMTEEYLRLRNPHGIYFAAPYFDKGNYHVHICGSGVEYKTGKSLRLTKSTLKKLKKEIQDFQIEYFPELAKSVVQHGKATKIRMSDSELQLKRRTGRFTNNEQVASILETSFKLAKSKKIFSSY